MTGENSLPISESTLPPCERFTVLEWRKSGTRFQCDVCDRPEAAHQNPGRRTLSGGEIETIRRRMIVEIYEKLEEKRQSIDSNGHTDLSDGGQGPVADP
jgi:hypothetical protein